MTTALASGGVQQLTITIASGQTTGTGSINAVGAGAFILNQGSTCSETAQMNDAMASVSLSGTTVTATRGAAGSSQTMTVNCLVIDGDTTNLIKTVQMGVINFNGTGQTATATLSAVTNANTAVQHLGQNLVTSVTPSNFGTLPTDLTLSGTTLTAFRVTNSNSINMNVGYCAIEFQPGALNSSVQNILYDQTTSSVGVGAVISSVSMAKAMISYGGSGFSNSATSPATAFMYAAMVSATQVNIIWNSTQSIRRRMAFSVIELVSALLTQSVQRGTIALAAASSNTATITAAPLHESAANFLNFSSSDTSKQTNLFNYQITQTNPTTLTASANTAVNGIVSWEVIDFVPLTNIYNVTTSDNVTGADSDAVIGTFNNAISDNVLSNDSLSPNNVIAFSISDAVTAAYSLSFAFAFNAATSDAVAAAYSITTAATFNPSISDAVTAADILIGGIVYNNTTSDAVTAADAQSAIMMANAPISDAVTSSFTAGAAATFITVSSENVHAADLITASTTFGANITDALTANYQMLVNADFVAASSDGITASDGISSNNILSLNISDQVTAAYSAPPVFVMNAAFSDMVSSQDAVSQRSILAVLVSDNITSSDLLSFEQIISFSTSDGVGAADLLTNTAIFVHADIFLQGFIQD